MPAICSPSQWIFEWFITMVHFLEELNNLCFYRCHLYENSVSEEWRVLRLFCGCVWLWGNRGMESLTKMRMRAATNDAPTDEKWLLCWWWLCEKNTTGAPVGSTDCMYVCLYICVVVCGQPDMTSHTFHYFMSITFSTSASSQLLIHTHFFTAFSAFIFLITHNKVKTFFSTMHHATLKCCTIEPSCSLLISFIF